MTVNDHGDAGSL